MAATGFPAVQSKPLEAFGSIESGTTAFALEKLDVLSQTLEQARLTEQVLESRKRAESTGATRLDPMQLMSLLRADSVSERASFSLSSDGTIPMVNDQIRESGGFWENFFGRVLT